MYLSVSHRVVKYHGLIDLHCSHHDQPAGKASEDFFTQSFDLQRKTTFGKKEMLVSQSWKVFGR